MNAAETKTSQNSPLQDTWSIALGMLWRDRVFLLPLYLLLVSPALLSLFYPPENSSFLLTAQVIARAIELSFLYLIADMWRVRLSLNGSRLQFRRYVPMLAVGLLLWLMLVLPVALQFSPAPREVQVLAFVLLAPGIILNIRFFFFFVAFALPKLQLLEAKTLAVSYLKTDSLLPLKLLFGPAAASFLIMNLIGSFSPDERSLTVNALVAASSGLFWTLTVYGAVAAAYQHLPDPLWRMHELDPYRQARFGTLAMSGSAWCAKVLTPRKAFVVTSLAALIWAGNFLRVAEMPPAATLSVVSATAREHTVFLTLRAEDAEYHLRGFRPIFLSLAGEYRAPIARAPERARPIETALDARFGVPEQSSLTLQLEFKTERAAEDVAKLEDLYLWYRNARLFKLKVIAEPSPPAQDAR